MGDSPARVSVSFSSGAAKIIKTSFKFHPSAGNFVTRDVLFAGGS